MPITNETLDLWLSLHEEAKEEEGFWFEDDRIPIKHIFGYHPAERMTFLKDGIPFQKILKTGSQCQIELMAQCF